MTALAEPSRPCRADGAAGLAQARAGLELGAEVIAPLAGTDRAPGRARDLVRAAAGPWHPCVDSADVCVSELVSNAVAHTRSGRAPGGAVLVTVQAGPRAVLIRVRDQGGPGLPAGPGRDPGEHGRGLVLVDALAAEWGAYPDGAGRVTWCLIETPAIPGEPGRTT
jgi:anti-sigma regulatory factor (Ser/Thr protein kinase)